MGLGKKLGQYNTNTGIQIQNSQEPLSIGGYNSYNIANLPVAQPLNDNDKSHIKSLEADIYTDYSRVLQNSYYNQNLPQNTNGLLKPAIPVGAEYPCGEVSSLVVEKMWRIICLKGLYQFYTQDDLQILVNRVCKHDYRVLQDQWNLPTLDMTTDLAILGLYDIVIFADDSGSMATIEPTEDNMKRFDIMRTVIETIGFWSTLMDPDGIVVRFFNSSIEGNGIGNNSDVSKLFNKVKPNGSTPMGKNLKSKIFNKIIQPVINAHELSRPVLIITVTDGVPDSQSDVINSICEIKNFCSQTLYGSNTVAFSFAQIGTDSDATKYLNQLDSHQQVGNIIDCTSEFSIEQKQCGQGFNESVWVIKLMIGAIDPSYDQSDEIGNSNLHNIPNLPNLHNIPNPSAPPIVAQAYPIDSINSGSIFNFGLG